MLHLQLTGNHDHSPELFGQMGNVTWLAEQNMENHGDQAEGRIEFRPHVEDETDVASPTMWKRSSPTETPQLQPHFYSHYKSYHLLSPVSKSQAMARSQQQLLNMIKDMPESSYELSFKDIVEQPIAQRLGQVTLVKETKSSNGSSIGSKKRKNLSKKGYEKKQQFLRIGSMSSEPFLLSKLFPTSWGMKNEKISPCSKFCTRPRMNSREAKKSTIDKNWWEKGFSVAGGNENSRSESTRKSSGSSNCINRKTCDLQPGCLSFIYAKAKLWDRKTAPFERDAV